MMQARMRTTGRIDRKVLQGRNKNGRLILTDAPPALPPVTRRVDDRLRDQ